jgi:thioredoxin 1
MIDIQTIEEFEKFVLKSDTISVVDFWAEWCGPCRAISPIVDELSNEYETINFFKVNIDRLQTISSKYTVFAIPTLIIFRGNEILARMQGASSKDSYKKTLDGVLNG